MKIPFSPPYIDSSVADEVLDTLKSGWITTGPKVALLEKEMAAYLESGPVVCVNSWTSAAIMMLSWYGVGPGDEVIVPAYTYSATALAVLHCGAKPVMVDVQDDFTMDPQALARAITSRTKAVIPVDVGGWPADYDAIRDVVTAHQKDFIPATKEQEMLGRILVLADAAHSFGARYNGSKTGVHADLVLFSLHAVKNLTTAEGGAICLNMPQTFDNEELKRFLKIYSLNGQTKDALSKSRAGSWQYDIVVKGFKYNMPDICAAIGLAQLREYEGLLERRRQIDQLYRDQLSEHPWAMLPPRDDNGRQTSAHLFMLRIKNASEMQRNLIIEGISKSEVSVNVHFIPMPMMTLFRDLGYSIDDYPVTYKNYACEISLPIYPQLTDEQVRFVADTVIKNVANVLSGG